MLEAAVARKGLAHRVTFIGMLNRREVLACLGRASLLIQPSMSEGLSMSIIEALAAGLPVLISKACNLPEVGEARAGRVVEPERRVVARALREMIALKDETLEEMGRNGRHLAAERYDWSKLVGRYHQMYTRVVQA
jgi:glycosyltransferase involved in cell wall biosynthesis